MVATRPAGQLDAHPVQPPGPSDALEALPRVLETMLIVLACLAAASWFLVAIVNVDDAALLTWDDGARMGLADSLGRGTLYPPLFDGIHYGGTRFMPLPILVHGGLSFLTGELVSSGKLATYLSFAGLAVAMFAAMRRLGSNRVRPVVLIATLVATQVGALASLAVTPDALPVALQLLALLLVTRSESRSTATIAGLLCSAAFLSKVSALWGFAAIAVWLWRRSRQSLVSFLAASFGSAAVFLALTQVASGGRFAENVFGLSTSGLAGGGIASLVDGVTEIMPAAPTFYLLLPLAVIETVAAVRRGSLTIFHLGFLFAAPVAVAVQLDFGASTNHFLDLICLEAVLTAGLWARWDGVAVRATIVATVLTFALISSFAVGLQTPVRAALRQAVTGETAPLQRLRPLDGLVAPGDLVLSEDASVPLALGQVPVVLDPFMLARIGERDPGLVDPLVARLERREFDFVVLVWRLDDPPLDGWYEMNHLGSRVTGAIRDNYEYLGERGMFDVYVPRGSG